MQLAKTGAGFDRHIENYIRELFEERGVSDASREKLWQYYYDHLSDGIDAGYDPEVEFYDAKLAKSLKDDVARFSAFKETSFKGVLESLLTRDGEILPWSEFKKMAYAVSEDYNKRWIKTEYNQTVANANAARIWKDIERNADLYPNVRYEAVNDGRTREQHREWDGTVLPINHPFWQTHFPPQDWGCRCNGIPTDEESTVEVPTLKVKKGFDNNPGASGKVFSDPSYAQGMDKADMDNAIANFEKWGKGKDQS